MPDNRAVGLLGGTFDPVHIGHLRLALEIVEHFDLGELRLVPNAVAPLRGSPIAAAPQRLALLHRAVAGLDRIVVDDREIRRGGVSYTVDTLREVRAGHGAGCLLFVLGMDAFLGLPRWRDWREILDLANLLVVTRPDAAAPSAPGELAELLSSARTDDPATLLAARSGRVLIHPIPLFPVSSTDIRDRIRQGRSVDFLVPEDVLEIIRRERLYQS